MEKDIMHAMKLVPIYGKNWEESTSVTRGRGK
jgi:hypothetical protein